MHACVHVMCVCDVCTLGVTCTHACARLYTLMISMRVNCLHVCMYGACASCVAHVLLHVYLHVAQINDACVYMHVE